MEKKVLTEQWRQEYNTVRLHSSLGYRPPTPTTQMFTHASFPTYSTTAEINNSRDKTTTEKVDSFSGADQRRASDRRLKAVKFPNYNTLDTFNFKAQPSINKVLITELTHGEYIDRKENVLPFCNS